MAVCVHTIQQPDGAFVLALDPAATNLTACQYVVQSGSETTWAFLSIGEATIVSMAIALLWAGAWGFRQIAHAITTHSGNENE